MNVTYERIERTGTPSVLTVRFGEAAIQEWRGPLVGERRWTLDELGNKQIAPQPATSIVGDSGLHYTFPATAQPAAAVFSLQPSAPGLYGLTLRLNGSRDLHFKILVMP